MGVLGEGGGELDCAADAETVGRESSATGALLSATAGSADAASAGPSTVDGRAERDSQGRLKVGRRRMGRPKRSVLQWSCCCRGATAEGHSASCQSDISIARSRNIHAPFCVDRSQWAFPWPVVNDCTRGDRRQSAPAREHCRETCTLRLAPNQGVLLTRTRSVLQSWQTCAEDSIVTDSTAGGNCRLAVVQRSPSGSCGGG